MTSLVNLLSRQDLPSAKHLIAALKCSLPLLLQLLTISGSAIPNSD